MKRTLVIGIVLFVAFAVALAPAALVRTVLPAEAGVALLDPQGTLWDGTASLYLGGQPAGRLDWNFRPVTVLQGELGYAFELTGPEHALTGAVGVGAGAGSLVMSGRAAAAFVNRWLAPYDIAITGDLMFESVELHVPYDYAVSGAGRAGGNATWPGGPIRYRLGGTGYAGSLPPLVAYLGEGLEAVVYPQDGQTPLLRAELLPDGFVKIGVTQLLTRLAGNPWPGSHADHEVVLEVEEQLF